MYRPLLSLAFLATVSAAYASDEELSEVTVEAKRVANEQPASTYASLATALRFDPLTELQSRGLPEGQADVTVRGGLFENTGFQVGAVTVTDPQTGHYFAELPIDPAFLTAPVVLQGVDNALAGFNSAIATVNYGFRPMQGGGNLLLGAGSDSLNFQSLRVATVGETAGGSTTGIALSWAASEGDGTIDNGDHDFERINVHVQSRTDGRQTDLVFARQDKFYGWPGAYTGFANLLETDDTETSLFLANHRRETDNGFVEFSAYHRRLVDDYDFDRTTTEAGAPGSFDHETAVTAFGLQGSVIAGGIDWRYGVQYTADELVRSTDLTNGDFTTRRYLKLSLVPEWRRELDSDRSLRVRAGATFDSSDRDSDVASPVFGVALANAVDASEWSFDYAQATQVPGYTVLQGRPAGLFGGNPELGRERARQLSLGYSRTFPDSFVRAALFAREDIGLIDWTFASGAPFARQANPVDIDVTGLEVLYRRNWRSFDLTAGYTWLDKDADYGSAVVDASFYALNYAEQRLTIALTWAISGELELRLDNEYRDQVSNPLRGSADTAYIGSLALGWTPLANAEFLLAVDNLSDDDFEFFPGTPGVGRQVSASLRYRW